MLYPKINILAISGSLREHSYNTAALQALIKLSPENTCIVLGSIAELPLFNPDLDAEQIPALLTLKRQLQSADGLVIASPEYAHGISGPLKNALDWLVSGEELPFLPVMLINTSPRASHAMAALKEVLTTMSATLVAEAETSVALLGSELNAEGIVSNSNITAALQAGLASLQRYIVAGF